MTRRLSKEKSPYLQQHANNPIDWYPWGVEAFEAAKKKDLPVFLSIGYATCHWCHVMEREVFSKEEVGKFLNENFISIKVDREEHPEVDSLYMDFAQILMGGGGGWPLNLILAPDQKPLLAATYLPLHSQRGLPGFLEFMQEVKELWNSPERAGIVLQSEKLVEAFAQSANATGESMPGEQVLTQAIETFYNMADPVCGGMKGEPKFPLGYQAEFLLSWSKLKNDSRALYYVTLTLDNMERGGIYDHLGGGFARYAVDEEWTIPHFEKMLYDNSILARTYEEAWKATGNTRYKMVARETFDYLLRDLQHADGGFFSGEDADSNGKEGLYYTWTPDEVKAVVQDDDADLFCAYYDVTQLGNYEGRSVLHVDLPLADFAQAAQMSVEEVEKGLHKAKKLLFEKRSQRTKPLRDEKILTGWNGLAIDALAKTGEPKYVEAALKAAQFIKKELWKEGKLFHRWCGDESRFDAVLEDYAFLIKGLLTLYEAGQGDDNLRWAQELAAILERDFKELEGAFYQTNDTNSLLIRKCDFYDGSEPSGNAVHTENLLRLYLITGSESYFKQAEDILKASAPIMQQFAPAAFCHLSALLRYLDKASPQIEIAVGTSGIKKGEIQKLISEKFIPNLVIMWKKIEGPTTFTLCKGTHCEEHLTKYDQIVQCIKIL